MQTNLIWTKLINLDIIYSYTIYMEVVLLNRRLRSLTVFLGIPLAAGVVWWVLSPAAMGTALGNGAANGDVISANPVLPAAGPTKSTKSAVQKTTNDIVTAKGNIVVDVEGNVQKPGLHAMNSPARVQDAIDAAGGITPDGTALGLNLAAKVTDGAQIVIPAKTAESVGQNTGSGVADATIGKVSLNRASSSELSAVPGIAKTRAAAIVKYRLEHGPFLRIEDLLQVKGITQKVLDQISPKLTLN
ncbi:MAG: competence protein ComEA [Bacilli bacterium]|nr:competence protein ComEA [Bacilli bacterium]